MANFLKKQRKSGKNKNSCKVERGIQHKCNCKDEYKLRYKKIKARKWGIDVRLFMDVIFCTVRSTKLSSA